MLVLMNSSWRMGSHHQRAGRVSDDGMRFLLPVAGEVGQREAPFTMVLNWQVALKK